MRHKDQFLQKKKSQNATFDRPSHGKPRDELLLASRPVVIPSVWRWHPVNQQTDAPGIVRRRRWCTVSEASWAWRTFVDLDRRWFRASGAFAAHGNTSPGPALRVACHWRRPPIGRLHCGRCGERGREDNKNRKKKKRRSESRAARVETRCRETSRRGDASPALTGITTEY